MHLLPILSNLCVQAPVINEKGGFFFLSLKQQVNEPGDLWYIHCEACITGIYYFIDIFVHR